MMMGRRELIKITVGAGVLGSIGGCTSSISGGSDIKDTDGDGVIDSEDYAPRDPEVQEKSDLETSSQDTPTSSPTSVRGFSDGFEDGSLDGWSQIQTLKGAKGEWSTTENAISGSYSMQVETHGDGLANIIATDEPIIDMSEDFSLSVKWRSPDPNNRGLSGALLGKSGNDFSSISKGEVRNLFSNNAIEWHLGGDAISKAGSPFKQKGRFSGSSFKGERPSLQTDKVHSLDIMKRGAEATFSINGERIINSDVRTDGTFRLLLYSSGTWGADSVMTVDDISLSNV